MAYCTSSYRLLFQYLFNFWLCCVFMAFMRACPGCSSSSCSLFRSLGFSLQWLLLLWSKALGPQASVVIAPGPWSAGSVVVAHGLSCPTPSGIPSRHGTHVPSIGRQLLIHSATREVPSCRLLNHL